MVWMGVSLDEPSEHKFNIIFRKCPAVIRTYSSRDKILNINPSILPGFLEFQVYLASSLPPFPQRAVEVPRKYIASFVKCNIRDLSWCSVFPGQQKKRLTPRSDWDNAENHRAVVLRVFSTRITLFTRICKTIQYVSPWCSVSRKLQNKFLTPGSLAGIILLEIGLSESFCDCMWLGSPIYQVYKLTFRNMLKQIFKIKI